MKGFSFWFKFVCILGALITLASFGIAGLVSQYYAQTQNKTLLKEMSQQSSTFQVELEEDIRYLISDLIKTQSTDSQANKKFPIYGSIDKEDYQVKHVYPRNYEILEKGLSQVSYDVFKKFPVAFKALPWTSGNKQVLLMVDVDQIQQSSLPSNISKGHIFFGLVSTYGLRQLNRALKGRGFSEAFVLDRKRSWSPIHSKINYSGHSVSTNPSVASFVKENKQSWSRQIDSEKILTAGMKMKIVDAYLILNKATHHWKEYYITSLNQIFLTMVALGLVILIASVWWFYPIIQAYEYMAHIFKQYSISAKFPIPPDVKRNAYITHVLPWLKNIYWKLREKQLAAETPDYIERARFFSVMMKQLTKNFEKKYPHVRFNLKLSEDLALPVQENWLKQAFLEVLKNAVECMNYQGSIDIHTYKEDQMFYCTIRDYGPGMSQENMGQACDAYFTSKNNASGLGLTLASSALFRVGANIYLANADDGHSGLIVQVAMPLNLSQKVSPMTARLQV